MLRLVIGMFSKPIGIDSRSFREGFTLIEILIVLLIIGVTITFALLSFGDFGAKRRVQLAAEQFSNYVKLVQQQAILETGTLGVKIDPSKYQALRYDLTMGWQPMLPQSVFRARDFPNHSIVRFKTKMASMPNEPQIVINESGDMTRFELSFAISDEVIVAVEGHHNGFVAIKSLGQS